MLKSDGHPRARGLPKMAEPVSLDALLEAHLPADALAQARRIMYGSPVEELPLAPAAQASAAEQRFDLKAFKFPCKPEQGRPARVVRVAAIQVSKRRMGMARRRREGGGGGKGR